MIATKKDAYSLIDSMSDAEFSNFCTLMNSTYKSEKRKASEKRFVDEVQAAEESVASGNYVTLSQLQEFLGVDARGNN